jgi:hypothetical protein
MAHPVCRDPEAAGGRVNLSGVKVISRDQSRNQTFDQELMKLRLLIRSRKSQPRIFHRVQHIVAVLDMWSLKNEILSRS